MNFAIEHTIIKKKMKNYLEIFSIFQEQVQMEISYFDIIVLYDRIFLHYYYNQIKKMKAIVTIPKKSSSLLLLRKTPSTKFSLYNYQLLVLQRKEKLSFGSGLVFPGGKVEPEIDHNYCKNYGIKNILESAIIRQCYEETGLYFSQRPIFQSQILDQLSKIRIEYIANEFNQIAKAKQIAFGKISKVLSPTQNLTPYIRLITIPEIKQRYDTTFYVLPVEEYKYINFFKYSEHQKHLHNIENIVHCDRQFTNFRWMNPAQILNQHFKKTSLIHPPQFILLNIMLHFHKSKDFIDYLKTFPSQENRQQRNNNLGPNIVSLIRNKSANSNDFPYAATLVGDAEFPFEKIIENEEAEDLKKQMREWQSYQQNNPLKFKNRFLFRQPKKFFLTEYQVETSAPNSALKDMKDWIKIKQMLSSVV